MPDTMSDSEIQSLLDKASPRPWISSTPFGNIPMQVYRQHAPIALMASWEGEKNPHDCNLIAKAPDIIPHLLKRAQDAEAKCKGMEEALKKVEENAEFFNAQADDVYCRIVGDCTSNQLLLGEEAKLAAGQFTKDNLVAHRKHQEEFGRYKGMKHLSAHFSHLARTALEKK